MIEPRPENIERILQAIRGGNFRSTAARWGGIEPEDLAEWLKQGEEDPEGPFGELRKEILEAETQAEITCVALVMKAAREDFKAAEWWLSRKIPNRWAKKLHHEVTHVDKRSTGNIARELLADPQLRHLLDAASVRAAELEREGKPGAQPGGGDLASNPGSPGNDPVGEGERPVDPGKAP